MAAGLLNKPSDSCGKSAEAAQDLDDPSVSSTPSTPKLKQRDTWQSRFDFLLAICGASVGLGNVWRFPYLCYKNGGGVFLIPYFVCVFFAGVPLFFLEVSVGQFMSECIVGAFGRLCPLLKGVGFTTVLLEVFICVYYNIIIAWTLYYIFASFTTQLPWATCGHEWNSASCSTTAHQLSANVYTAGNNTDNLNATFLQPPTATSSSDPATEYWTNHVLNISGGIEEPGPLKWDLVLCLLLAWVIVYLCICKGIKSSGKVMYVTATSPYLLLLVLLIRGLTLPGAMDGIKFYLVPDWSKLLDPQVWTDAGTQVFFSYSIGHAKLVALGSYNAFKHNAYGDTLYYAAVNSGTSFLSGFVIFPVLGFMAYQNGLSIKDVAASGPGLAFIAYPKAVAELPFAPVWSIIFFLCLLMLGLDSQFVGVEAFCTTIVDMYPQQLRRGYRREVLFGVTCFIMFICGLPMVTYGGMYVFLMFDYYMGSRVLLAVSLTELVLVAYCYGAKRYNDNMKMMLGFDIGNYMKVCWTIITPIITLILAGLCFASIGKLTYNKTYQYPVWSEGVGWSMAGTCLLFIPLVALYKIWYTPGTFTERIQKLLRPQLKAHQMRPEDDPKDLMPGEDSNLQPTISGTHTYKLSDCEADHEAKQCLNGTPSPV